MKRGKKEMIDDDYNEVTGNKIKEWEDKLISGSLTKEEKKALINRISA